MKTQNWKIIYNKYGGMQRKAVELIAKEMGALTLRNEGVYTIHVLPCEKETASPVRGNAVVIGLYCESEIIRRHIAADAIQSDGYAIKVMDNPDGEGTQLALITAHNEQSLFYGAVEFLDDYFALAAPKHGPLTMVEEVFEAPLPLYEHSSAPAIKKRSVFTWGHPINDYRNYIENMARLKLNQLIIWNDYVPLNAKDVVDYAHEFGIEVIWGFAWGWSRNCANIDIASLESLAGEIIKTYEEQYRDLGGDGIYFQSFTELQTDKIGDNLIAEVVTNFVNTVSGKLLYRYPNLFIQFGLHASSVKEHLEFIAKVDKRVEIVWEDCGVFPYGYNPFIKNESEFDSVAIFTDKLLNLRKEGGVSVLYKGFLTLDWVGDRFVHQAGPFVLGDASKAVIEHDLRVVKPIWRHLQSGWLQNGEYAHRITKQIFEHGNKQATVGMAGQFAGGIWFPQALCAQILWECDKPYSEIFAKVSKRRCVDII